MRTERVWYRSVTAHYAAQLRLLIALHSCTLSTPERSDIS